MGGSQSKVMELELIQLAKDSAIVIVGGGPAGVHMASELAKKGYSNLTILEAEKEVGGKSFSPVDEDNIPHDMGTCYLHNLYGPIRALLQEFDPDNHEIGLGGAKGIRKVFGTDLRGGDDDDFEQGKDWSKYMLEKAEEASSITPGCYSLVPDSFQYCHVLSAIQKYNNIHKRIFGKYEYGVPPKPNDWKNIDMTAHEFLKKNDILALDGMLRYTQQVQGYGVLEDIPAFYMLWWMHPDLLSGVVDQVLEGEHGVTMLSKGYQSLWKNMAKFHTDNKSVKIIYGAQVKSVTRGTTKTVVYQDKNTNKEVSIKFDKVIMALNLSLYLDVVTDLAADELKVFSGYDQFVLSTTLYEADPVSHEHPVEIWFARMRPDAVRDGKGVEGRFHMHRNSRLALHGVDSPPVKRERRVAYQFLGRKLRDDDPEKLQHQLLKDLELAGESNVEILIHKPWPYMPQFTPDALRKGNLWKILEMQGKNDTLWIGSSVCFESVLDCVHYNNRLVKRLYE